MTRISDTSRLLNARKEALTGGNLDVGTPTIVPQEDDEPPWTPLRKLFIGTDVDVQELVALANFLTYHVQQAIINDHGEPHELIRGLWIDGVLFGLMYAQTAPAKEAA